MLGSTEIIVLVVVIGVLIFGAKKIPELAKTFGKAKGEFEKGKIQGDQNWLKIILLYWMIWQNYVKNQSDFASLSLEKLSISPLKSFSS